MQMRKGNYYWTPYANGKVLWKPLGNDYVQALLKWRELEGLNEGAQSVGQMLQRALGFMIETLKPSTFKEFTRASNLLTTAFEGFIPSDVEPRHIAEYLEKRTAKVSANREITFFSSAWELARRRGWINLPNPALGIRRNKERSRKRVALPHEIAALLSRDEPLTDMVELALMTAMRESDMLNLTLQSLEAQGIRLRPRKTDESTQAEQLFLWTPELRAVIERTKARRRRVGSMFLFPVKLRARAGQAYTVNTFQNVWKRYFERCNVEGLTWHDLRPALNLRERAEGKDAAQKLGAHSSVTTTEGYLRGVGAVELLPVGLDFRSKVDFRTSIPAKAGLSH